MSPLGSVLLLVLLGCADARALAEPQKEAAKASERLPRQVASIALAGVSGRIDHLAIDLERKRLYVAALGNGSLETIDLPAERPLESIKDLHEPQGVLYLAELDRIVVSNGATGMVDVFDAASRARVASLNLGDDADNLRWDARKKQVVVGYGKGGLGVIDAQTWKAAGRIALPGHPEAFALEQGGARAFVNVPGQRQVVVVDRETRKTLAVWPIESAQANFPMVLIEAEQRLLVACREPSKLVVLDTRDGKELASFDLSGDADDVFFDEQRGRVYVSCGAGSLDVFERVEAGRYAALGKVATAKGARTSLYVPQTGRIYVAAPARGEEPARILIFEL